jgi:putative membrane protein
MKRIALLSVALAATLTIGCRGDRGDRSYDDAGKRNEPAATGTAGEARDANVDRGTRNFIEQMMLDNMAEVQLGKLAGERAQNPEVRQFGHMMVQDHSKAEAELKEIVTKHHIDVQMPSQVDDKHRDLQERLSKLKGPEFDREYIKAMVDGHEDVLDKLQSRVDQKGVGKDRDKEPRPERSDNPAEYAVNTWAAKTLPVVREHLDRAKQIQQKLEHRTTHP